MLDQRHWRSGDVVNNPPLPTGYSLSAAIGKGGEGAMYEDFAQQLPDVIHFWMATHLKLIYFAAET
jgi:hypothetical protein